jgi:hypothetical protein
MISNLPGSTVECISASMSERSSGVIVKVSARFSPCAIGTHLTPTQLAQLCEHPNRCVYIAFDQDENQVRQTAADALLQVLDQADLEVRLVGLPSGHDPNSYFVAGASAQDFDR